MRITQEADYALRITNLLAEGASPVGAPQIAAEVHIPHRFAMKILRKLTLDGILKATRGASGGYSLLASPKEISIRRVIEAIDGPIEVQKCLGSDHVCTRSPDKDACRYHRVFMALNEQIVQSLESISVAEMADTSIPIDYIINKMQQEERK